MAFVNLAMRILCTISVFTCAMLPSHTAIGEEPWEFSSYQIRTWLQFSDHPTLNQAMLERITRDVPMHAELVDKSGWKISVEQAPREYSHFISRGVENIQLSTEQKKTSDIRKGDRIAFASVSHSGNTYRIQCRQFDCQTYIWGPTSTLETNYRSLIPRLVYQAIRDTLVPVAKIEKIEGKYVRLRIRASQIMRKVENGMVISNSQSPAWIDMNSIFMPIVRQNDKDGNIRAKDGIKVYDWTYLKPVELVQNEYVKTESYLKAEIHGATRAPLAGRTNRSQRKYALVIRPTLPETRLKLLTREKVPKPIPDKQIFVKYPGEKESKAIGRTDRNGEIVLKSNDQPLHLIYIKSGEKRILARLPVVPGFFGQLSADMKDDKVRLRAEGVLSGLEFNLMDLTIRRQVLALRIRSILTKGNHLEARRIYNEKFIPLEDQESFKFRMNNAKSKLFEQLDAQNREENRQKKLIAQMFNELTKLVDQKIARKLKGQLNREIQTVEDGGVYKGSGDNLDTSKIDKDLEEAQKSESDGAPSN